MYNTDKHSLEQKIKQEKMNMILNNLEQKLGYDEALCHEVAGVICIGIEIRQFVNGWEKYESRFQTLSKGDSCNRCIREHNGKTSDIHGRIKTRFEDVDKRTAEEKYAKVRKTIQYCVENSLEYKESKYYYKYWVEYRATRNLKLDDLPEEFLML